jgi:hypothetical protein
MNQPSPEMQIGPDTVTPFLPYNAPPCVPSVILEILVAVHDLGFEESRVLLPELCGLPVQGRGAAAVSVQAWMTKRAEDFILVRLAKERLQAQ